MTLHCLLNLLKIYHQHLFAMNEFMKVSHFFSLAYDLDKKLINGTSFIVTFKKFTNGEQLNTPQK